MTYIPWTLYAMRLRRVAQRLAEARSGEELRRCLTEHSALWQRIDSLIEEVGADSAAAMQRQVLALRQQVGGPSLLAGADAPLSPEAVPVLIALNQQAADLLPVLDRGTPVQQWLN